MVEKRRRLERACAVRVSIRRCGGGDRDRAAPYFLRRRLGATRRSLHGRGQRRRRCALGGLHPASSRHFELVEVDSHSPGDGAHRTLGWSAVAVQDLVDLLDSQTRLPGEAGSCSLQVLAEPTLGALRDVAINLLPRMVLGASCLGSWGGCATAHAARIRGRPNEIRCAKIRSMAVPRGGAPLRRRAPRRVLLPELTWRAFKDGAAPARRPPWGA